MTDDYTAFKEQDVLPDRLFNYECLNIQRFLESVDSWMRSYHFGNHLFSEFLDIYCSTKHINPKLILVSLQREQGILKRKEKPENKVLERALGVGCTDSGDNTTFYGFEKQISGACNTYIRWFKEPLGLIRVDFGKKVISPANHFTFSLYKYTPHVDAAKLTWTMWKQYWPDDMTKHQRG